MLVTRYVNGSWGSSVSIVIRIRAVPNMHQTTKAVVWCRQSCMHSYSKQEMEISGQLHAPPTLPLRKDFSSIHSRQGWVAPRTRLDMTYTYCCVYSARLLMMDRETVQNM